MFIGKISSQKITVKGEFKSFNCTECDVDSFVINEAPTLETLILDKNNLQKIDLKKCDKLTWLSLIQNYFTELDLRENPTLKRLYCSFNQFGKIRYFSEWAALPIRLLQQQPRYARHSSAEEPVVSLLYAKQLAPIVPPQRRAAEESALL